MSKYYDIPGHDHMLLAGSCDDSDYSVWADRYCDKPDAEIAEAYAQDKRDSVYRVVAELSADDERFCASAELAECFARFKGFDTAEAYLADKARNDDGWLTSVWEAGE